MALCYGVEHLVLVVTVRGKVGTQPRSIRKNPSILASYGTRYTLPGVYSCLSKPGSLKEVIIVTVVEGRCLGRMEPKLELHDVWSPCLKPDTVIQLSSTTMTDVRC